ncbi:MAG: ribonuclease Y [Planctomycetales bacterium 4484_113]|nr:MAG: ribonuclease Y [Planctomycetales bacterium 4484_113]
MELYVAIILLVVVAALFLAAGYFIVPLIYTKRVDELREKLHSLRQESIEKSEAQAREILGSAKQEASALQAAAEKELKARQREFERREKSFYRMEDKLAHRLEALERRQSELDKAKAKLRKREQTIEAKLAQIDEELSRVAEMSRDEARELLLQRVEEEVTYELDKRRHELELHAQQEAMSSARKILVNAMGRCSVDHYSDAVITTVELKKDDMKGRIIGREGRNIRSLEQLTGVDIIIDDTPNVVVLSGFDPIRREVARMALERLITDGRIHPAKIEEVVGKVSEEMQEIIWEAGQEATFKTGITGLHPELIKLLGKLKFRTSFGQNVLRHSIEVAHLSGVIASELGMNPKDAKRGGLLHDIGKAVDAEFEGTHQQIGMEVARKYGENETVVNAIGSHHGDIEQTLEGAIVQVADALSASRPGARGEAVESYLKRLQKLEAIGKSFPGVDKCYAIQAGRELRVLVKPETVDDVVAYSLCRKITKRIEQELEYPGMIKVTLIREFREIEYAK